ncbi:MAG: hypothetical protein PHW13_09975 [Methylococcales bacterium]|nr:hypothetical protein [Methylococcales bacterium]
MQKSYLRHATLLSGLVYLVLLVLYFFSDLAIRPIWTDETLSYFQVSDRSFAGFLDSLRAGVNVIPYFYFILLWCLDQLFGLGPGLLRLPSLVFSVAAVLLLHRLLKTRYGHGIAFMACISALLLSKEFILFSHEARPYSLYILAAVFCLYSSSAFFRQSELSGRTVFFNGMTAFFLPSVHYFGIFYSFFTALAVLLLGRGKGRKFLLLASGSFLCGWLLFAALHFSQIMIFAENKGAINPAWIPKPDISQVYEVFLKTFALPPIAAMILVAYGGYYLFAAKTGRPGRLQAGEIRETDRFLFVLALFWLLPATIFNLFGAVGLPNLTLSRYFAPSLVALAVIVALLFANFLPKRLDGRNAAWPAWGGNGMGICIALIFSIYPLLTSSAHIVLAYSGLAKESARDAFKYITESPLPAVTNNKHIFFEYTFNEPGGPPLYLLIRTAAEADSFQLFDSRLSVLTEDKLVELPAFRFIYQKGTVNSFSDFDIDAWGEKHGFDVQADRTHDDQQIYTVRKKQ